MARAKASLDEIGRPLEPSRVVAGLSFGFWTSLRNQRNEQRLWPSLLKTAFPFLPKGQRTRKTLSTRLDKVRCLRNRVLHREPIWHWRDLVRTVDRFPADHAGGAEAFEGHLALFCRGISAWAERVAVRVREFPINGELGSEIWVRN